MSIYFDENGKMCYKSKERDQWIVWDNSFEPEFRQEYQGYTVSSTSNDDYKVFVEHVIDRPEYKWYIKPKEEKEENLLDDELFEI